MIAGKGPVALDGPPAAARPMVVFTRSFRATKDTVRESLLALTDRVRGHVGADLMSRTELVLAELLNNVAQHGRPRGMGAQPLVHMSIVAQPDGLACSVSDDGGLLPGVCLSPRAPDPATYPEGGFGWFLIDHLTQSLVYFRENDRNFVAFTVPVEQAEPH
ncbi:serine/threonine-protein kinase RsbW [Paracoccus isoporae]|uniref:Serine/threonine-protein kinase RsbW n=1 Tax=Paracoccus isoporae TaxID=591205 RepID=A0A1G7DZS4_9RHOB|nr:ATP-binding protein [Paracoccus isoporae]SDE56575.1 serine/threonine-protein kinase RsbW [Paracoccus isoporae]